MVFQVLKIVRIRGNELRNCLRIYRLANDIADIIWNETVKWDYLAKDTVGKQLIRSADSMGAIIAEGYAHFHFKENKNFLYYSRGSAYETRHWINKVYKRKLIAKEIFEQLSKDLEIFLKGLNAYINTVGK